jgi:protein SMG5
VDVIKKIKRMDVNDMLEIITEEGSLQAIKIINDWLMQDTEIIKSCGTSTRSLLRQITNMLNLININVKSSKLSGIKLNVNDAIKNEEKIPLSEDVVLKGIDILGKAHKNVDWNYLHKHGMNTKEESVTRIVKFMAFGRFLTAIEETGIGFDEHQNVFVCKTEENDEVKTSTAAVEDLVSERITSRSGWANKYRSHYRAAGPETARMRLRNASGACSCGEMRPIPYRCK